MTDILAEIRAIDPTAKIVSIFHDEYEISIAQDKYDEVVEKVFFKKREPVKIDPELSPTWVTRTIRPWEEK